MILTIIRDGQLLAVRETLTEAEAVVSRFPGAEVWVVDIREGVAEYGWVPPIALRNTTD